MFATGLLHLTLPDMPELTRVKLWISEKEEAQDGTDKVRSDQSILLTGAGW